MGIKDKGFSKFEIPVTIKVTRADMIKFKLKQLVLRRLKFKTGKFNNLN